MSHQTRSRTKFQNIPIWVSGTTLTDAELSALPPQVGKVIKFFQAEIDRLTSVLTQQENLCSSVLKDWVALPNPVEVVDHLMKTIEEKEKERETEAKGRGGAKLKLENEKLKKELAAFQKEFEQIQNQEITIRKLQETIHHLNAELDGKIQAELLEKESALKEEFQIQLDKFHEQELEFMKQISQSKSELEESISHNSILRSQMFDMKSKYDVELNAKQMSVDMLTRELERMTEQFNLYKESTNSSATSPIVKEKTVGMEDMSTLSVALVQKDLEIGSLQSSNQNLSKKCEDLTVEVKELKACEKEHQERINALSSELEAAPKANYVLSLEKKLKKLKQIIGQRENVVWSASETDTMEPFHPDGANQWKNMSPVQDKDDRPTSTSSLLVRNRFLENEMVQLKTSVSKLTSELSRSKQELEETKLDLQQQRDITFKWESDLDRLQKIQNFTAAGGDGSHQGPEDDVGGAGTGTGAGGRPQKLDDDSMRIFWHQRELYKEKVQQLETSLATLQATVHNQFMEIKKYKSDNLKLYQNVKFLESRWKTGGGSGGTGGSSSSGGGGGGGGDNSLSSVSIDLEGGVECYKEMYDESVNPFAEFRKKEKLAQIESLNPFEKIILKTTRYFLSTRKTRVLLCTYLGLLHLLVFFSLAAASVI
eukprot:TRINITY_DN1132_c1_g1_i6.p1 TRINITY_DN1132_c1_g1~~TRINITY_DN1132_c1_g1_i6.p1  ORF type:complete len:654 (+),score=188.23 TRINITY_DN1132_c1_g1_i6:268-2229(+)